MDEFRNQYLCVPTWTENDLKLEELAKEYVDRTEAYDRLICTGPIGKDGIRPANIEEHSLINRNANKIFKELKEKANNLGFSGADLLDRIRKINYFGGK